MLFRSVIDTTVSAKWRREPVGLWFAELPLRRRRGSKAAMARRKTHGRGWTTLHLPLRMESCSSSAQDPAGTDSQECRRYVGPTLVFYLFSYLFILSRRSHITRPAYHILEPPPTPNIHLSSSSALLPSISVLLKPTTDRPPARSWASLSLPQDTHFFALPGPLQRAAPTGSWGLSG